MEAISIDDLMINNYLLLDKKTHRIVGIKEEVVQTKRFDQVSDFPVYNTYIDRDYIKPIQLTEEILLKCGFVKHNEKTFISYYNENLQINFIHNKWLDYVTRYHINYLHELQNIYYWRTKQHLQIKW